MILWNTAGEITEATIANVVVEIGGERWTPPRTCGLLPGIARGRLVDEGNVGERRIAVAELKKATRVLAGQRAPRRNGGDAGPLTAAQDACVKPAIRGLARPRQCAPAPADRPSTSKLPAPSKVSGGASDTMRRSLRPAISSR